MKMEGVGILVHPINKPALNFYLKNGFICQKRKDFSYGNFDCYLFLFLQNEYMKKIDEKFFVYPEGEKKEATIDSLLAPGEEVLWRGKPNRKAFIGNAIIRFLPFALLWLCFDIGFVVMMFFCAPNVRFFDERGSFWRKNSIFACFV